MTAICDPHGCTSLIQKQGRAPFPAARLSPPVPVGRLAASRAVLFYRVRDLVFILFFRHFTAARGLYASAGSQHLRLWRSFLGFAHCLLCPVRHRPNSHTYYGDPCHLAHALLACALGTELFHEYGVRLPRLLAAPSRYRPQATGAPPYSLNRVSGARLLSCAISVTLTFVY